VKLFEPVEEPLNQVAIHIQVPMDGTLVGPIGQRRNDGISFLTGDLSDERVGIVPLIGKNAICDEVRSQGGDLARMTVQAKMQAQPAWQVSELSSRTDGGSVAYAWGRFWPRPANSVLTSLA
jgi:hypothetical protein